MPSGSQVRAFSDMMKGEVTEISIGTGALDSAIDWISHNLDPQEVFSDKDLEYWAEKNGFKKED